MFLNVLGKQCFIIFLLKLVKIRCFVSRNYELWFVRDFDFVLLEISLEAIRIFSEFYIKDNDDDDDDVSLAV